MTAADRRRFFDHLIATADNTREPVLRRQAIYLLSFDSSARTQDWLEHEHLRAARAVNDDEDVPAWVAARSSAVSLTRHGRYEPLEAFVASGLTTHRQELANLNYWAYWLGEIPETQVTDRFMIDLSPHSWSGTRVFAHLLDRIGPSADQLALNTRTLWHLVLARPNILKDQVDLRSSAMSKIGDVLDCSDVSAQVRRDLSDIAYAIKLADR